MPGVRRDADRDRIESSWFRQGFLDAADGRVRSGPDPWDGANAGLDCAGAYERGYLAGCEQYVQEHERKGGDS